MDDHPFWMWSLAEATHWLIHLPFLGIIVLVVLALVLFFLAVAAKEAMD